MIWSAPASNSCPAVKGGNSISEKPAKEKSLTFTNTKQPLLQDPLVEFSNSTDDQLMAKSLVSCSQVMFWIIMLY